MDHQAAVFSGREEELVIVAQSHPLHFTRVRLDLCYFLESIEPPNLDGARPPVLTHACEEVFARLQDIHLRQLHADFDLVGRAAIVDVDVPDLLVASHHQHLVRLLRHVADASELDGALVEVFVLVAHACLPLKLQVVEVGAPAHVAARKAEVVLEPVNAAYLVHVTLAHHALWTLSGVEIEDMDRSKTHRTGEHMASVSEFDFVALLQHERRLLCYGVRKDIHHRDLLPNCRHYVEPVWMECNGPCFICGRARSSNL